MSKIALVIPYRKTPNRDEAILHYCIKAWSKLNPDEIILVDSSEKKVEIDGVTHLYRPYKGKFNLSFMRNVGMRYALDNGFDYVQIMDNDIFPKYNTYFENCLKLMPDYDIVFPLVANSPKTIPSLDNDPYKEFLNINLNEVKIKRYSYSTTFQKIQVPQKLHGYDEAFELWGAEDDDYRVRSRRQGFKSCRLPNEVLIHSWHHGDTAKKSRKTKQYDRNVERFKKTTAGLLPDVRMPDDWGLHPEPRTNI